MKRFRLNRRFNSKSGHGFDVAMDHGSFHGRGVLSGTENLERAHGHRPRPGGGEGHQGLI